MNESTLTGAWLQRGPVACLLWPFSLLFGAIAAVRRALYKAGVLKTVQLPVPVVVVGNIFIGGTGKTPLTIWLVDTLRAHGFTPGVVSRGFGAATNSVDGAHHSGDAGLREVTEESTALEVGDEPLLIARRAQCPVVVGRDRPAAARELLYEHPEVDVIISDDGLQHYALARDIEILLFDTRGAGNGWLLPAGPLREPRSRRRDFTIVNATDVSPELAADVGGQPWKMTLGGSTAYRLCDPSTVLPLAEFKGKRLLAAAGIGNPGRFFAMLTASGLAVDELALPDHHDFLDDPFSGTSAEAILLTEKDAVKCGQLENMKHDPRLWVVPVNAVLDAALAQQIVEKCRGRASA